MFFTLTFAGEVLGLSAANAVLDIYDRIDITKDLHEKGLVIKQGLESSLNKHELNTMFEIQGMSFRNILGLKSSLDSNFLANKEEHSNKLISFMVQQLAEKGILFNTSICISYSHTYEDIQYFLDCFDEMCLAIKQSNYLKTEK